jgi:KDO2-lipid IV(A) lauroyltransferase
MERRGLNIRKWLLGIFLPLLRRLPLALSSRLIAGVGRVEYALFPGLRWAFQAAVVRGSQRLGCTWNVPAVSRRLCGNQVRFRTRDRLLDGITPAQLSALFTIEGRENLDAAFAQGKGVIVLSSHFGGHLLPAHWLFRQGYTVRFYMERPRHVSRFLSAQFATDGPLGQSKLFISRSKGDPAGSASSILRAARILQAGMIIYLAGDVRWTGPNTQVARFMGRQYYFSATWVRLAALTGAPVVPVFCTMRADGTYHIDFRPAYAIPEATLRSGPIHPWVQTYLRTLEDEVRRHPENSNEYFFWSESDEFIAPEERAA